MIKYCCDKCGYEWSGSEMGYLSHSFKDIRWHLCGKCLGLFEDWVQIRNDDKR